MVVAQIRIANVKTVNAIPVNVHPKILANAGKTNIKGTLGVNMVNFIMSGAPPESL